MIYSVPTVVILLALGINVAVNGPGCWGLQPGGVMTMRLFSIQVLIAGAALVHSVRLAWQFRVHKKAFALMGVAFVFAGLAVWQYSTVGWRLYTSGHNQGMENLPTFVLTAMVALVVSQQLAWSQHDYGQLDTAGE